MMTNNDRWLLAVVFVDCVAAVMAVVDGGAVIVDGGSSRIELTVPMAASLTVAAVDGGGNYGVFTTVSHDNYRHSHPHPSCPCPLSDKD